MLSFILLGLVLFVYNWGVLACEGVIGKVGVALSFVLRVRLGRECTFFWFCWGVSNFGVLLRGLGFYLFVFVCLLGGVAASCQVFKALKLVPIVITGWLEVISL